ncbi:STAS domain-containing protein [Methylobacterium sp. JK268]
MTKGLALTGPCGLKAAEALRETLIAALAEGGPLDIDGAGVERADIAFVQLLVSAQRTARARGGALRVTNLPDEASAVFLRAGVDPARFSTPS